MGQYQDHHAHSLIETVRERDAPPLKVFAMLEFYLTAGKLIVRPPSTMIVCAVR